jgi:ABC-type transporter Mla MlaB component
MSPGVHRRRTRVVRRDTYARVVLARDGAEVASWPLVGSGRVDLGAVDQLAQWQLVARRVGCCIRLRDACVDLVELLDLVGLDEGGIDVRLGEAGGEAEGGE